MQLSSPDFKQGETIPDKHSYEGGNLSPALQWQDLPEGTRSLAVFCHDPDAPLISATGGYGFVHWLIYNIPVDIAGLAQGQPGYVQGQNDFGGLGYGGPQPPKGHGRHHYYFWLLALTVEPSLQEGLGLADFLEKMEPHIIGMNRLMGTYEVA
jgi:hypothetical protein